MQITQEIFNQISFRGLMSEEQLNYLGETKTKGWPKRVKSKTILIGELNDLMVLRTEYIKKKYAFYKQRKANRLKPKNDRRGNQPYIVLLRRPEWKAKRLEVIARDGHKCTKCDKTKYLQVHHLSYTYGKMPWEYELSNLVTVCSGCHRKIHGLEGKDKNKLNNKSKKRKHKQ